MFNFPEFRGGEKMSGPHWPAPDWVSVLLLAFIALSVLGFWTGFVWYFAIPIIELWRSGY